MREVLSGTVQSRLAASEQDETTVSTSQLGGSCTSLNTVFSTRPHRRSSLETILDTSIPVTRQQLFLSMDSLASCSYSSNNQDDSPTINSKESCSDSASVVKTNSATHKKAPGVTTRKKLSMPIHLAQKSSSLRPNSVGSCLDIVRESVGKDVQEMKCQSRATSCLNVNNPTSQQLSTLASHPPLLSYLPASSHHFSLSTAATKAQGSSTATEPSGPTPASSTSNLWPLPAPAVVRRCFSSLDVSKLPRPVSLLNLPVCVPARNFQLPQPKHEHSKTLSPLPVCLLPN